MASFILRYSINFIKDSILTNGYDEVGKLENATTAEIANFCTEYEIGWTVMRCRLVVVLSNYAIISNYFWLLVEGIYLQMLLGLFMIVEEKCLTIFAVFAWGGPWVVMALWIYLLKSSDEIGCWEATQDDLFVWTLKAPVLVSIIINFVIFINIIRIIVSKLRRHNMNRNDIKFRLAKSTLALIPLLGIHFILFDILSQQGQNISETASNVIDCTRMVFLSIQGALVTIFYCFMNGEVKSALKEWWRIRNWKKSLPSGTRTRSESLCYPHNGNSHTSVTYFTSKKFTDDKDVELNILSPNGCGEFSVSDNVSEKNCTSQRSSEVYIKTPQKLSVSDYECIAEKSTSSLIPTSDNNGRVTT